MFNAQMRQIEEELTPFGLVENGLEVEQFVEHGDLWNVVKKDDDWRFRL
jgi:hypothetical protein